MSQPAELAEEKRCLYVFPGGRRCRAARKKKAEWCFFHDTKGKGSTLPGEALLTTCELLALLARTLYDLRGKKLSPGEAYATGYLVQVMLAALQRMEEKEYIFGEAKLFDSIRSGLEKSWEGGA